MQAAASWRCCRRAGRIRTPRCGSLAASRSACTTRLPEKKAAVTAPAMAVVMPDAKPGPLLSNLSVMSLELRATILAAQKNLPEAKALFAQAAHEEKNIGYREPPAFVRSRRRDRRSGAASRRRCRRGARRICNGFGGSPQLRLQSVRDGAGQRSRRQHCSRARGVHEVPRSLEEQRRQIAPRSPTLVRGSPRRQPW